MVSRNILLTNHHVLNSIDVPRAATIEFDYQITEDDLLDGPPDSEPAAVRFRLNPDRLFLTSKMNDFDYTFVWIDAAASDQFGSIQMTRGSFTVRQTEPTYIIHHPGGAPKQTSLDDTEVLSINSSAVLYAGDTAGGSSGAPVFCRRGRLVALHHAWRSTSSIQSKFPTLTGRLNDGGYTNVVNEGIKMSAIAIDLEGKISTGGAEASAATTVLEAFKGSDTLTGLFGSLGRHREAEIDNDAESELSGPSAYEKVVRVYQGKEMDIDIGAWNIEWLNRDYTETGKLERIATIITDLNLDIWALVEVSADAVNALIDVLKTKFKQEYKAGFSEPDASGEKQTTAVPWRATVVEGQRMDWPEEIDNLFKLDSRDELPFEAVHGKIFNRYPGLFKFKLKSEEKKFDFFLVPLHLKAKAEGGLRRSLASKALSYAVQQMVDKHGADSDWILLGDVNSTLASGDFDPLTSGGFTPLSAEDEKNGAFTYLKAPYKSLIDNIFVSANMSKFVDSDNFYIVETDRTVSRFVQDASDHRPIALRLSLTDIPDEHVNPIEDSHATASADEIFDTLIANSGQANTIVLPHISETKIKNTATLNWLVGNRSKTEFFRDNAASIKATIREANQWSNGEFGAQISELTLTDVAVVFMAEAGLTASGVVDPHYIHSNGEYGLLPLPRNITYWVDNSAPDFNSEMSISENIRYYFRYLVALKNKSVKSLMGRILYRELFQEPGITEKPSREASLLAGVVHGYFWDGNYSNGQIPVEDILRGYVLDMPLGDLMRNTVYVHAGKSLMDGRQRNIDAGLAMINNMKAHL